MVGSRFAAKLAAFSAIAIVVSLPALSQPAASKSTPAPGHIHTTAAPEARVVANVDNSKRTTLYGHVPGVLRAATDMGRLDPNTPAEHLILALKSSGDQERELRRVLDEQQDSRTANYHQWATPEQFGQYFGVHDDDIAKVSAWLQSQGFTVEDVAKSKRMLHFSGTTGQLESAFATEMHTFQVNGETHVSNNSEISVPTALSPVIAGVTLNNFFRKSHMTPVRHLKDLIQSPDYTSSSTVHYVGPWDFATIYNTFPLLSAGINGTGSSIAIVGRSDILLSDVQTYRTLFDLPNNDPIFIHAGQDNGIEPGDDGESDLDVEISGGIAPNAQIYFVIGTPTFLVDGITNSIMYIVENNLADIMSISYGSCEAVEGAGGNALNSSGFEQAAAQGISIFVAAGDNGPAECDDQNDSYEVLGYAAGAESSTPYNVSAGGTGLAESLTTSVPASILTTSTTGPLYWSATTELTPPYWGLSALSYIPETPWNISKVADYSADPSGDLAGLWSGSGGISSYYIQPSWQRGSGVYTSDPPLTQGGDWVTGVTLTNGGGSGYTTAPTITFTGGGCVAEPTATTTISSSGSVNGVVFNYGTQGGTLHTGQGFGCTSAPTVAFGAAPSGGTTATGTAAIGPMWNTPPLISGVPHRYTPDISLNADDGNDPTIFCSEGICEFTVSGTTTTLKDAGLVGGTSVAAPSMAGIQALINQANGGRQGAPNYIYYTLSAAQTESGCNSSLGTSIGSTCAFHDITSGDNLICGVSSCTKGTYPSALSNTKMGWLAGTGYDLATGLGSINAANLSSQWKNVVFNSTNTTLNLSQTTGIAQGGSVTFSGTVAAGSGSGTPTGDVAFILSQGDFGFTVNVNTGGLSGTQPFATLSGGSYTATLANLPAGTYNVTARYGGDQTYASSVSAPVQVTVGQGAATVTITPEWFNDTVTCTLSYVTTYTYGQFAWIPAAVTSNTGQGVPTGTVTFTVDGVAYGTETLDPQGNGYLAAGTIATSSCLYDYIFAQSPTLTGGTHVIGASYSGDSTFGPATATPVTITVTPLSVTPTLSAGATYITSGASVPLQATFTTSALTGTTTTSSGPTGTVTFMNGASVLGTAAVVPTISFSGNTYTYGATAQLITTAITATGANSITAVYSGDTNFSPTTSAAVTVTVGTGAGTTTVVTSSANPTTLNGRPTLTATIGLTGAGTAPTTGTVSFYDSYTGSPVLLGTGAVGSAHTATFRPASGAAFWGGAHPITAVYGGIAADAASFSPVFTQNVTLGTTTISLAAKLAGTYSQAYTLAAVITPSNTNATYAPNQSVVNFFDGSTLIGSSKPITVTSAQGGYGIWTATFTTNALTAGTHTMTATYSDINYSPSTSNAQTVTVNQATPAITWPTPAPIIYGTPLGAAQLDASSKVAGTYAYTPPAGTILTVGSQPLSVTFTPTDTNDYTTATAGVTLTVNQATPPITWATPAAITYGTPLSTAQLNASSTVAGTFAYSPAAGTVLTAGSQLLKVTFTPTDTTDYTTATASVTLTVNQATPVITWATPAAITYGTPLSATQLNASSTVAGTFAYSPVAGTVLTAGSQLLKVTFTPTDTTDYTTATSNVTLTVNQATPSITWATPAAITYGTALSTTQLNASSTVAGTYAYSPAAGTVLTAGSQPLSVTFTPTDTTDYTTATSSVTLTVNQATPPITWATPAAITYGTALSATQLNASSTVAGKFVYTPAAGTVLTAGSQPLSVTFSPTDTTDYTTATSSVTLTVNKATPAITWATPAAITYGTALSATQLNASSTVAGTFAYSPAAGTVLTAGSQPLSVTFTPTDATDYTAATSGVTLTVNQATQAISFTASSPVTYGVAPITLSATGGSSGNPVTFSIVSGGSYGSLSGANNSVLTITGAGTVVVAANQAGNSNYLAAPAVQQSIVVNTASQTITFAPPSTVTYGVAPIALSATGGSSGNPITFTLVSGPAKLSGSTLTITGAGTVVVAANQAGNSNYAAAPAVTATITVNKATPGVLLTSNSNPVLVQNSITLTATVSSAASMPTGTVTFNDGATPLGTGTVNASGVATYSTTSLAVGTHSITAVYMGDANFVSATSGVLSESVQDFNLTITSSGGSAGATTATAFPGGTAVYTFTFSPTGATTFPAAIVLSASGLPAGATYSFSPATLAAGTGSTTVTFTIQLPQVSAVSAQPAVRRAAEPVVVARNKSTSKLPYLALALLLLPFAGRMRRTGKKLGRLLPLLLLLIAGIAATAGLNGCASKTSGYFAQAPTTYTITVTGTSGALIHSTSVTLIEQ